MTRDTREDGFDSNKYWAKRKIDEHLDLPKFDYDKWIWFDLTPEEYLELEEYIDTKTTSHLQYAHEVKTSLKKCVKGEIIREK
jgi:hypothetical protein